MTALADAFEAQRAHLVRVAYGQLGSLAEAEDVVQEAWMRLQRVDPDEIRDLRAWLTTTVSRLALDALRSARARRERYVGPWLPEPLVSDDTADPADRVTLDESIGMALLVVLETLSAAERVAFVLHDVFGYPFEQVAEVLGGSPEAARQLASRARRHVEARRPRFPASFYVAFALLFAWAAVRPQRALVVPRLGAWSLAATVHLAFHASHLEGFGTADALLQTAGLALAVVVGLAGLALARPRGAA